jgi:hypothetical protein
LGALLENINNACFKERQSSRNHFAVLEVVENARKTEENPKRSSATLKMNG